MEYPTSDSTVSSAVRALTHSSSTATETMPSTAAKASA